MKIIKSIIPIILLGIAAACFAQLTPQEAVDHMMKGINLGNTLEPPNEGGWNNGPAQEYYFDDYKAAGFQTVRIPVRWDEHTAKTPPYQIKASWMDRVQQIVDWALERDLFVIINAHHESWIKENYTPENKARFDSIWVQISERFQHHSEKLFFEMINEPKGLTLAQINDLNKRVLSLIRRTNPTRIVIYSGHEWSALDQMMQAAIPDDDYIMAYFHSYDPWSFGGEGNGTWGTTADRNKTRAMFERARAWSDEHGVPVMISEFGAVKKADYNSRMKHYYSYVEFARANRIIYQAWDDGGNFGIYDRKNRTWPEVKDILIHTSPEDSPGDLAVSQKDSSIDVTWSNRAADQIGLVLQRRVENGEFEHLADLTPSATSYVDSNVTVGKNYTYCVIATFADKEDAYSWPQRAYIIPSKRSPYQGQMQTIPGAIEAEFFDEGGELLTYHDTTPENIPGELRPNDGVDIEKRNDGGYQVAYIETGEWLEYTVDVQQAGEYTITTHVASMDGGGRFRLKIGSKYSRTLTVPKTSSWQKNTTVETTMRLTAGETIMRIQINDAKPFNIDKFVFELKGETGVAKNETIVPSGIKLYPNPVVDDVHIAPGNSGITKIQVFNVLGQQVRSIKVGQQNVKISLRDLPAGSYFVTFRQRDKVIGSKMIVRF